MGTHVPYGITVLPATRQRWHFHLYPSQLRLVLDLATPQGWVDLVGLVTYQGHIPTRRRSPIPVLTGLNIKQLHSCDERCYHSTKPPTCSLIVCQIVENPQRKPTNLAVCLPVGCYHITAIRFVHINQYLFLKLLSHWGWKAEWLGHHHTSWCSLCYTWSICVDVLIRQG